MTVLCTEQIVLSISLFSQTVISTQRKSVLQSELTLPQSHTLHQNERRRACVYMHECVGLIPVTVTVRLPTENILYTVKHHPLVRGENNSLGCHSDKDSTQASPLPPCMQVTIRGYWCVFWRSGLRVHPSKITPQPQTQTVCTLSATPRQSGHFCFCSPLLLGLPGATTARSMPLFIYISPSFSSWPTDPPHCAVYSTLNASVNRPDAQSTVNPTGRNVQAAVRTWRFSVF